MIGTGGELGTGGALVTGAAGAGGSRGSGGMPGVGGRSGTGGTTSEGGRLGTGGVIAAGGTFVGRGGSSGNGGAGAASGRGGVMGSGGSSGSTPSPVFPPMFVGNTDTKGVVRSDFATYWDQLTPELAGKWEAVQTAADTFNWTALDALYRYAEDNHIIFKEHCFIGAMTSQPTWQSGLAGDTAAAAVKGWMQAFCSRYPETRLINVVSEAPMHGASPKYADAIGGGIRTTWDWIANVFKWAREACPDAILILDDYNNIEYSTDCQNTIDIVTAIQKLNAPIDAVGCQAHDAVKVPAKALKQRIDLIASSTGLPVYISEFDIDLADDEAQRVQYQDHFTAFMSNPNVKGVSIWGYIVGETWRPNTGIMTSDGTMRPAMTWLMGFLDQ
jgi:endo-1,4-beta-xylanase